MGERLDRTQEVAGSSPASSISKRPAIAAFRFPQRMGSDRTYGENLVAIDARSDDRAQAVADLLAAWEAEDPRGRTFTRTPLEPRHAPIRRAADSTRSLAGCAGAITIAS